MKLHGARRPTRSKHIQVRRSPNVILVGLVRNVLVLCSAPPLLSSPFMFHCTLWVCLLCRCRLGCLSESGKCCSACVFVGQLLSRPAGPGLPGQGVPSVATVKCSAPGCDGSSSELSFLFFSSIAPETPIGVSPSLACWVVLCGVRGSGLSPPLG